jgi:hypothetical protein
MAHMREYTAEKVLTVKECLILLRQNGPKMTKKSAYGDEMIEVDSGFIWYVVENKKGHRFEFGGRSLKSGSMEVKVYIPDYDENGKPHKTKWNDMCDHSYSVTFEEESGLTDVDYPSAYSGGIKKFKDLKSFISFIDNRDWPTKKIGLKTRTYVEEVICHEVENF